MMSGEKAFIRSVIIGGGLIEAVISIAESLAKNKRTLGWALSPDESLSILASVHIAPKSHACGILA